MDPQLYKWLETRIGTEGAKAARRDWWAIKVFIVVVLATPPVVYFVQKPSDLEIFSGIMLVLLAMAVVLYTHILLARAIATHINAKVFWYRIPGYYPHERFEKWLKDTKENGHGEVVAERLPKKR